MRSFITILIAIITSANLFSQHQALRLNSPWTGEISTIEKGDGDVVFAGSWGDGVYRSADKGDTWSKINNGLNNLYINNFDMKDGLILLATNGGGIYKSTDNGNNWTEINTGLTNKKVIAVSIADSDTLFATTRGNGVFRSVDGGDNWSEANNGILFQDMSDIFVTNARTVLAATYGKGLYRSTDMGETWERSQSGIYNDYIIEFKYSPYGVLFASTWGDGLFFSDNDGDSWGPDQNDEMLDGYINGYAFRTEGNEEYPIIATKSHGVWWWHELPWEKYESTIINDKAVNDLTVLSDNTLLAAAPIQGIIKSTDYGQTWDMANDFNSVSVKTALLNVDGILFANSKDNESFKSEDEGETWTKMDDLDGLQINQLISSGNEIFAITGSTSGKIWYSTDKGSSWDSLDIPGLLSPQTDHVLLHEYTDIIETPSNGYFVSLRAYYFYTGSGNPPPDPLPDEHIVAYTSNGIDWDYYSFSSGTNDAIVNLERTSNGNIYAAEDGKGVWKSTDNGSTWNLPSTDLDGLELFEIEAFTNSTLLVGTDDGIYRTTNQAVDWAAEDMTVDEPVVGQFDKSALEIEIADTRFFYGGFAKNTGVYHSSKGGVEWANYKRGFNLSKTRDMTTNDDADLYLLTSSIWRYINSENFDAPDLLEPQDGEGNITANYNDPDGRKRVVLEWDNAEKADMYQVQFSRDESFQQVLRDYTYNNNSMSYTEDLEYGRRYWWRVRSKTAQSLSDWSEAFSFVTELPVPDIIYPTPDTMGVPVMANLIWSSAQLATMYDIQISTSMDENDIVFEANDVEDTTLQTDALEYITKHYIRIRSKNDESSSRWGAWQAFTTVVPSPTLVYPEAEEEGIPVELTFVFEQVDSASSYMIQISRTPDFDAVDLLYDSESDSDSTHFFDILDYFKDYYWRMKTIQEVEYSDGSIVTYESEWSESRKFVTGIGAPELISPSNNSIDITRTPRLIWLNFADAEEYEIQLASDEEFENIIVSDTLAEIQLDIDELVEYEVYYWRVRVYVNGQAGIWSDVWKFRTIMESPMITSDDLCGSIDAGLTQRIDWEEVKGAQFYQVQVATDQLFSDPEVDKDSIDLTAYTFKITEYETQYFVRVRGYNSESTGLWSEECSFTTTVNSIDEVVNNLNLRAYPNPFRELTNISFDIVEPVFVKLSIYDMAGNEVFANDYGLMLPGAKTIPWQASNLSNGSYNYMITIGNRKVSGKLILNR